MRNWLLGLLLFAFGVEARDPSFLDRMGLKVGGSRQDVRRILIINANPFLGDNLLQLGLVENLDRRMKEIHGTGPYEIVYLSPVASQVLRNSEHVKPKDFRVEEALSLETISQVTEGKASLAAEGQRRTGIEKFIEEQLQPYLDEKTLAFQLHSSGQMSRHLNQTLKGISKGQASWLSQNDQLLHAAIDEAFSSSLKFKNGLSGFANSIWNLEAQWNFVGNTSGRTQERFSSRPIPNLTPDGANLYRSSYALNNLSDSPELNLVDPQYLPEGVDKHHLRAELSQDGLDPKKDFVLLNYNGGPDKALRAPYWDHYLRPIVDYLRRAHPDVNIVLTSPRSYVLSPDQQSLYQKAQLRLNSRIAEWNQKSREASGQASIAQIPHSDTSLLSAAVREARLIVSQDTGTVHFANILKRVPLEGPAVPQVISFVPGVTRWLEESQDPWLERWQSPSQPFLLNLGFAEDASAQRKLFRSIDAGLAGRNLPAFFGRSPQFIARSYSEEFSEVHQDEKNAVLEDFKKVLTQDPAVATTESHLLRLLEVMDQTDHEHVFSTDLRMVEALRDGLRWLGNSEGRDDIASLRKRLIVKALEKLSLHARRWRSFGRRDFPKLEGDLWGIVERSLPQDRSLKMWAAELKKSTEGAIGCEVYSAKVPGIASPRRK